ncbi:5035_t:CDS:2, partial [Scutellospora calospora]
TVLVSSSEPLSNLDSQFQVVKDPNARKSAHHEGRLTKSEEIVTQQTTPLDNIELQSV